MNDGAPRPPVDGVPRPPASGEVSRPPEATWHDDTAWTAAGDAEQQTFVVKPSLRAAIERFLTVFTALLAVAAPFAIGLAIQAFTGRDADVDPTPAFWGSLASLNLVMSIFVPAIVSLAPALQIAFTRYVFDEEGIRESVQLLSRTDRRVRWEKVTALHHRRTLLDRALGIERLDIVAYGERGTTLHLIGLRDAPRLRNVVARQMRREATMAHLFSND